MTKPSTQWEVGRSSSEGAAAASAAARRRGSASRKATLKARAPEEDLLPTDRQRRRLRQPRDDGFDLVEIVPAARQESEEAAPENNGLEIAQLCEPFPRDAVDHDGGIDLVLLDDVRDGLGRDVALDSVPIKILRDPPLRRARALHLGARVLLGEFRVVQKPVIKTVSYTHLRAHETRHD